MSTNADATLLPAPLGHDPSDASDAREPFSRHLHQVGVEAVLGAMIEQKRRASQPSMAAVVVGASGGTDGRAPLRSEVFLKAR
jgi:hypothetical protein